MKKGKIIGIFDDRTHVERKRVELVLQDLNGLGFKNGDISVLALKHKLGGEKTPEHIWNSGDVKKGEIRTHSGTTYPADTYYDRNLDSTDPRYYNEHAEESISDIVKEHDVKEKDPHALFKGASIGGALGIIGGLTALMIPGIGPILATGPIAAGIAAGAGGAAVGATTGTIIGLLKDEGIPQDHAAEIDYHFYKGDVIVIVHTDKLQQDKVKEIFARYNAYSVQAFF